MSPFDQTFLQAALMEKRSLSLLAAAVGFTGRSTTARVARVSRTTIVVRASIVIRVVIASIRVRICIDFERRENTRSFAKRENDG